MSSWPSSKDVYHTLHRLLFQKTPRKALGRVTSITFAMEDFFTRRIQPALGLSPSEKYFAYWWIFENLPAVRGRVLDVGCGDSLLPCELSRRGYEVSAIDLSSSPWSCAAPFRHPGTNFVQADICYAPYKPHSFTAILAVSTLEHIGEEQASLAAKELARILTDNGVALVTMPLVEGALQMKRLLSKEFDVSREGYYRARKGRWSEVSEEEAQNADLLKDVTLVHLVLLKK